MATAQHELRDSIADIISQASCMTDFWQRLLQLAYERGISYAPLRSWLDALVQRVAAAYGVTELELGNHEELRSLCLNRDESLAESALETILSEKSEATDELVGVLSG